MVCRDFILPEICKPCLFYLLFNLRNLFYLTEASEGQRVEQAKATEEGAPLLQPSSGFPTTGNPSAAEPLTGFPTELKKDTRNTDQENTDAENTHSLPIPSAPFTPPVEWS